MSLSFHGYIDRISKCLRTALVTNKNGDNIDFDDEKKFRSGPRTHNPNLPTSKFLQYAVFGQKSLFFTFTGIEWPIVAGSGRRQQM